MSMEAALTTLLKTQCPRVFPDFAPTDTPRPYVTYQGIGGPSLQWLDNTAADKRHNLMQVNVWDDTRAGALALARNIEAAMRTATTFFARVEAEPLWTSEPDFNRYGTVQDFAIYSTR